MKKHVCDDQFKIATIKLGHWRTEANKSDRLWPFYYSNSTDCIYRSWRRKWYCHKEYQYDILEKTEIEENWGGWNFKPSGNTNDLPRDAVPCDTYVSTDRKHWKMHKPGTSNFIVDPRTKPLPLNFQEYLKEEPEYIAQYYHNLEFGEMGPTGLYEALNDAATDGKRINIATDGGAEKFKGSLGFLISSEDGSITYVNCWGQASGYDPQSYRSEICAALAALRFINKFLSYYDEKCALPSTEPLVVH